MVCSAPLTTEGRVEIDAVSRVVSDAMSDPEKIAMLVTRLEKLASKLEAD